MPWWIDKLTDQTVRHALGRRFEVLTDEVFNVVRWTVLVGFAKFLANTYPEPVFEIVYYALAALLFGYLASRFLLRPEIPFMPNRTKLWQRLVQSGLNLAVCMVAFMTVIWLIDILVTAVAQYQAQK